MDSLSRRSFVKRAGVATGAAALGVAAPQFASAAAERQAEVIDPTTLVPSEPLVAYVRDAKRGEVTVLSGTRETTYRDPALVRQLVKAGKVRPGSSRKVS